ncbi:hypothetical protein PsorP6_006640 [Peronosclerospora sorghi]|uniref:Uncharacterized protein n=1 Tax=Peronosclerospora sorghi TaxID=230839 RepID=A0ACC0W5G3_9STRA|nr:hypothetical protein PsorP6_006640 [Peronosclerospora sorghi]
MDEQFRYNVTQNEEKSSFQNLLASWWSMRVAQTNSFLALLLLEWTCVTIGNSTASRVDQRENASNNTLDVAQAIRRNRRHDATTLTRHNHTQIEERAMDLDAFDKLVDQIKKIGEIKSLDNKNYDNLMHLLDELYYHLNLGQVRDKHLENSDFVFWLETTYSSLGDFAFPIFVEYYKDDLKLAQSIVAAEQIDRMKPIAIRFQKKLLKFWRVLQYNSDEVFKLLQLDQADNLVEDPLLNIWVDYVYHTRGIDKDKDKTVAVVQAMLFSSPNSPVKGNKEEADELASSVYDKFVTFLNRGNPE